MSTNSSDNLELIPAAIRGYVSNLSATPSLKAAAAVAGATTDFVYAYTATDRTYTAEQYPVSGTWSGTTTPWLNDFSSIPSDWSWTTADTDAQAARTLQVNTQMAAMKPPGGYTGTTAEQISQRYTKSMWAATVFPQDQLDRLFVWIDDDAEFARQRLGSANTNVIASAGSFDVAAWINAASNAASLSSLQATLSTAQSANELFVCDYRAVLGSVVTNQLVQNTTHLAAPVCFFTINNGALTPVAIQVQGSDASSYIFTPGDANDPNGDAWLLAKLWVANADQTWWFSGSHLYNTHSIDMVFGIAALNQIQSQSLPQDNPMLMLAKPHIIKVFNINNAVYSMTAPGTGIYQQGSFCDMVLPTGRVGIYEVINNLYENYDFAAAAFANSMASRGLSADSGPISTVSFPYRDDGQVWWTAIQNFVGGIVDASYTDDAAVAADTGLNGWMNAVQTAFNTNQGASPRFTWSPTKDTLEQIFTNLIFVCSVQHCSVNNSMFNSWAFTPNGPFSMQQAPPSDASSVTQAMVLASLPDPTQTGSDGMSSPTTDMALIQNQVTFVMNGTAGVSELLAGDGTQGSLQASYGYASGSAQYNAVTAFYNAIWTGDGSVNKTIANNQSARVAAYQRTNPSGAVPNSASYYYLSAKTIASMFLNAATTQAIQI